jgi:HK97 family phage prohead protease
MSRKLLSTADFKLLAQSGGRPDGLVARLSTDPITEVSGKARTLRFCFSDGSVDRAGDTIDPKGWQLSEFNRNPIALWAHDSAAPPIGRASNVAVVGKRLMGDIEFAPAETYEFADTIYKLLKGKFLSAVSVGFNPLDWTFAEDKSRPYGIDFKRQELMEISVCPVPCNANALVEARAAGINTRLIAEWAEKVLDTGGSEQDRARARYYALRAEMEKTDPDLIKSRARRLLRELQDAGGW